MASNEQFVISPWEVKIIGALCPAPFELGKRAATHVRSFVALVTSRKAI